MINLTDSALNAVRNAISTANKPVDGLRIMVEAGGCAGYKYMLGLVDEVDPDMLAIGWPHSSDPNRARIAREIVTRSHVPVLVAAIKDPTT